MGLGEGFTKKAITSLARGAVFFFFFQAGTSSACPQKKKPPTFS